MAIPPVIYNDRDWQSLPPAYEKLRELKACCGKGELSLGMSADLRLALQAGSTCVRVGLAVFLLPRPDGGGWQSLLIVRR